MEQPVEGRDWCTVPISPGSNTVIQPSIEDHSFSSSTSSSSSTTMRLDREDESTPLLLSASQHSIVEQQQEGRESNPRATFYLPRVEDESMQPFFSGLLHSGIDQQHEHIHPYIPLQGNLQVEIQQHRHRPFLISDPTQSSIMLRRNAHTESASMGRRSTSQESMQNVNPKRVKQLINDLGFDDQRSEMLYKLVIATAAFHNTETIPTSPAPEENNANADAVREALGSLMFAPKSASPLGSPTATTSEEEFLAGNSTDILTRTLLFDANAAENLGSCPLEPRFDSPPLIWSTAAAEESLDPNAEDPTYFTIAEFINTIVEEGLEVESVTDQDWWIEEVRVAILNRLKHDASAEDISAEEDSNGVVVTEEEATEETFNEVVVTKEEATEQVKAREDTSKSDLQRWKEQGPDGWLKRHDGTDMNEEEIGEECDRWDAMVRTAKSEKEAEEPAPWLGNNLDLKDKDFWKFVRSSKQKEPTQDSISTQGQDEKASVSTHDQDQKGSQRKKKKGSKKKKNKNRKAKKNALKGGNPEDMSEEVRDIETFPDFLDLPTQVRNKVLAFVLVVHQELVPYHYVNGKVVKNVGLRKKPELNILLALCSSKDKKIKKCLDDAKNILYRDNIFSIRKPNDLIIFLDTIGGDNVARMKMGKNLLLTDTFFDKRRQCVLEMKWLARWGKDLLFAMKGHSIVRSDIVADSLEDDLTCEPTDIEKALKSMVEVMKDEGKTYEMLKENGNGNGSVSSPMRLQSLDLGEKFELLAEQIKNMGLAIGDGKVTKFDTAQMPEMDAPEEAVESMSEKWKRKAREAGRNMQEEDEVNRYGELFLKVVISLEEEDEEDILSQDSGFYTPSVYSEHGTNDNTGGRGKAASRSTTTLDSNSEFEREIMELMDASFFGTGE